MDPQSPNKFIATKIILFSHTYSEMIPVSFSLFLYFSLILFVDVILCYYLFLQTLLYFYYFILFIYFFLENYFMFRNVPACSGMFLVPGFYRRPKKPDTSPVQQGARDWYRKLPRKRGSGELWAGAGVTLKVTQG